MKPPLGSERVGSDSMRKFWNRFGWLLAPAVGLTGPYWFVVLAWSIP